MSLFRMKTQMPFLVAALFAASTALAPRGFAQEGSGNRFLIYFDEFSANLTQQARGVIADAARRARESNARAVRVEARSHAELARSVRT